MCGTEQLENQAAQKVREQWLTHVKLSQFDSQTLPLCPSAMLSFTHTHTHSHLHTYIHRTHTNTHTHSTHTCTHTYTPHIIFLAPATPSPTWAKIHYNLRKLGLGKEIVAYMSQALYFRWTLSLSSHTGGQRQGRWKCHMVWGHFTRGC